MEMYSDLKMFDLPQEYFNSDNSVDKNMLIKKKADWDKNIKQTSSRRRNVPCSWRNFESHRHLREIFQFFFKGCRSKERQNRNGMRNCLSSRKMGNVKKMIQLYISKPFNLQRNILSLRALRYFPRRTR